MILVQNLLRPLSGNKKYFSKVAVFGLLFSVGVSSCAPKKVGALRSPDFKGTVSTETEGSKSQTSGEEESGKGESVSNAISGRAATVGRSVSLVLPFQLNQIATTSINTEDVKRSALALDFYQGFQFGLEELATKGIDFFIDVKDSQDSEAQNISLARSISSNETSLVIGPVYPKEIKAFGQNLRDKSIYQVNPLAASMASEYGLPNLITLTPSIKSHMNAIASEVARTYRTGDVVIIYNTSDNDSRQFLSGMLSAIKQRKSGIEIYSVSDVTQLNEKLTTIGNNLIVAGTTDKLQIRNLVNNISKKNKEELINFSVFGHPLWDRYDFSIYANFSTFSPVISSESHLKNWSVKVKDFKEAYHKEYGILPSDHSYKGYDAAIFFGTILDKHGREHLENQLLNAAFDGIFSSYKFEHNDLYGFTNEAVALKIYRGGSFQLK